VRVARLLRVSTKSAYQKLSRPGGLGFGQAQPSALRSMLPAALRGNFQDLPAWRYSVVELLRLTLAATPVCDNHSSYPVRLIPRLQTPTIQVL
jgi:hypothetical protein